MKMFSITMCSICALAAFIVASSSFTKLGTAKTNAAGIETRKAQDDKPFNQEQALAELRKKIAAQKDDPAEEVFSNIEHLKGVPAGRLLAIMEIGYSKSLGVDCTHCHVAGQWAKDEKPTKRIARDMAAMLRTINSEHLPKIKNLKSENPVINCTTCHRGQTKPALNLQ